MEQQRGPVTDANTWPKQQTFSHPEQLIAALFSAPTVGVAICDRHLRYQAVNQTLASFNGVPVEAHFGKSIREVLGEAAADTVERPLCHALVTGEPVTNVQISVKLPTRPELGHWIGNYYPFKDSTNAVSQLGVILVEVTDQKRLESSLQALTRKLLRAQDEEQRRIARELHDSINQYHVALKMNLLRLLRNGSDKKKSKTVLAESIDLLDQCMAETRTVSYLLHPPLLDEMGFASASRWYVKGFSQRSGIEVNLRLAPEFQRLPSLIESALFRILQEALTNVHRHAHTSRLDIEVERHNGHIRLQVRDYGRGIAPEKLNDLQRGSRDGGLGLASMRERVHELGGILEITSSGLGTLVTAEVPVPDVPVQQRRRLARAAVV